MTAHIHNRIRPSLVQMAACCLTATDHLNPCWRIAIEHSGTNYIEILSKYNDFELTKMSAQSCPSLIISSISVLMVIQIKICAEYRDMLPRPRLVCQEPGLRPIGRSPGVPDKSSRGLGSMSRYSAQILICFIAYIFSIFNFSVGLVGNLAELPPCTVPLPLFIVIRMRLLSAHQTIKSPSMPCWGAAGRNTLWHSCHITGEISR